MLADADQTVEQTGADAVDAAGLKGSAQAFLVRSTLKLPKSITAKLRYIIVI